MDTSLWLKFFAISETTVDLPAPGLPTIPIIDLGL